MAKKSTDKTLKRAVEFRQALGIAVLAVTPALYCRIALTWPIAMSM